MSKFVQIETHDGLTLDLLREHRELGLLAMDYLEKHWDELPCEDLPLGWVAGLAAEFEAALEDRGREWLAAKVLYVGPAEVPLDHGASP